MFEFIISVSGWLEYFNINERSVKSLNGDVNRYMERKNILIGVLHDY